LKGKFAIMTTSAIKSLKPRIEPTRELLERLTTAQLKCAKQHIDDTLTYGYGSDDGCDYLKGALTLARDMTIMNFDGDLKALDEMLNGDETTSMLADIALHGIAQDFYDLDCNAIACLYGDE
jgi:hypothetical protein